MCKARVSVGKLRRQLRQPRQRERARGGGVERRIAARLHDADRCRCAPPRGIVNRIVGDAGHAGRGLPVALDERSGSARGNSGQQKFGVSTSIALAAAAAGREAEALAARAGLGARAAVAWRLGHRRRRAGRLASARAGPVRPWRAAPRPGATARAAAACAARASAARASAPARRGRPSASCRRTRGPGAPPRLIVITSRGVSFDRARRRQPRSPRRSRCDPATLHDERRHQRALRARAGGDDVAGRLVHGSSGNSVTMPAFWTPPAFSAIEHVHQLLHVRDAVGAEEHLLVRPVQQPLAHALGEHLDADRVPCRAGTRGGPHGTRAARPRTAARSAISAERRASGQVDLDAALQHRRRHHEDDEQHEHDVHERNDVDLRQRGGHATAAGPVAAAGRGCREEPSARVLGEVALGDVQELEGEVVHLRREALHRAS